MDTVFEEEKIPRKNGEHRQEDYLPFFFDLGHANMTSQEDTVCLSNPNYARNFWTIARIGTRAARKRNDALIFIRKCAHRQSPHPVATSPNAVSGNGKQKIKQKIPWKVLRQTNEIRPRNTNEKLTVFRDIETAQNGIVRGCRSNASLVGINGINQNCHQVLTSPIVIGPKS